MSRRIVERAGRCRADLVLVVKCHWLHPLAVSAMQSRGAAVMNYYPDSPFERSRSNTSPWLPLALPRYDAVFTFAEHLLPRFRQAGCARALYLPFASDPGLHRPAQEAPDVLAPFRCEVAFVGNVDEERARWLGEVAHRDLRLWGASYCRAARRDPALRRMIQGRPLYGADFAKAVAAAAISLNLMRRQNAGSHNMRTFEAAACRGFVVSQRTAEVTRLFAEEREAVYFSSPAELRFKVDYYLARPAERRRIAEAGWRRAASETYARRARRILEEYEAIAAAPAAGGAGPSVAGPSATMAEAARARA
jgi:spore maturation protein CgeB